MKVFVSSLREGLFIAFRALLANKSRSLLTTLGIVIGVLTVTLMMMIIQGLNESFTRQISFLGSNTVYIQKWPWIITDGSWWKYINRPAIRRADYEFLRERAEVPEIVSAFVDTRRTVGFRDNRIERVDITGATPSFLEATNMPIEHGRSLTDSDDRNGRSIALIGSDIQTELFGNINPIGRRIRIGNSLYRVVGILEQKGEAFGQSMDRVVVIPMRTFENTFGHRRSISIAVKAPEGIDLDYMEDELIYLMRQARRVLPRDENNFVINRQEMLASFYKRMTAGIYAAGLIIGGIALLVGGVGIMNIMLVSVAERTWEVGMRKAIGAKTKDILWQFLVEAMLICILGGTIGLLLAAGAGMAIKQQLPVTLPIWLTLLSIGFSATLGLVFGIFPAAKAARMDPIAALRQE